MKMRSKKIFKADGVQVVENISPYLTAGGNIAVCQRRTPLNTSVEMTRGSTPTDGGFLLFNKEQKDRILVDEPGLASSFKRIVGGYELVNSKERWCLWFSENDNLEDLMRSKQLKLIFSKVRQFRLNSKSKFTREAAATPHLFTHISQPTIGSYIAIPNTTSQRRLYIPIAFIDKDIISTCKNYIIPNGTLFDFGLVASESHMDWMRLVAGRMKSDYSYTNTIVYNTFPFPQTNEEQKKNIEDLAMNILMAREEHPDKTLAQMYDPDTMPQNLLEAHRKLDRAVDELYKPGGFKDHTERIEHLLKLYEKQTNKETAH